MPQSQSSTLNDCGKVSYGMFLNIRYLKIHSSDEHGHTAAILENRDAILFFIASCGQAFKITPNPPIRLYPLVWLNT